MIDFDLYKLFYAVAKCGSLSKAAEELYISQSSANHALQRLEKLLGTTLFNRLYHGMELSSQGGKTIFDDVEQAVNHYGISHGVHFKPAVEVNSWGFMKRLVVNGMGIGCIPQYYKDAELLQFRAFYVIIDKKEYVL